MVIMQSDIPLPVKKRRIDLPLKKRLYAMAKTSRDDLSPPPEKQPREAVHSGSTLDVHPLALMKAVVKPTTSPNDEPVDLTMPVRRRTRMPSSGSDENVVLGDALKIEEECLDEKNTKDILLKDVNPGFNGSATAVPMPCCVHPTALYAPSVQTLDYTRWLKTNAGRAWMIPFLGSYLLSPTKPLQENAIHKSWLKPDTVSELSVAAGIAKQPTIVPRPVPPVGAVRCRAIKPIEDRSRRRYSSPNRGTLHRNGHATRSGVTPPASANDTSLLKRIEANARERTRVHTISAAFQKLRTIVPAASSSQRLSRLTILRIACDYIMLLAAMNGLDYSADQKGVCIEEVRQRLLQMIHDES